MCSWQRDKGVIFHASSNCWWQLGARGLSVLACICNTPTPVPIYTAPSSLPPHVFFPFIIKMPVIGHKTQLKSKISSSQRYLFIPAKTLFPVRSYSEVPRWREFWGESIQPTTNAYGWKRDFIFTYLPHLTKLNCSDTPLPWTQTHFWGSSPTHLVLHAASHLSNLANLTVPDGSPHRDYRAFSLM